MAEVRTEQLWRTQNRHPGDRESLFGAASEVFDGGPVLYPGSYVDIAASFVFPQVTYVDSDRRAAQFLADRDGVTRIVDGNRRYEEPGEIEFIHADYRSDLPVPEPGFDLLVALYAGFVSEGCKRYLRPGGLLLANNSHGDAGMASLDPDFELAAVINKRDASYLATTRDLDRYLVPKKEGQVVTDELLRRTNRGVAYTRSPSAYLFRKTAG